MNIDIFKLRQVLNIFQFSYGMPSFTQYTINVKCMQATMYKVMTLDLWRLSLLQAFCLEVTLFMFSLQSIRGKSLYLFHSQVDVGTPEIRVCYFCVLLSKLESVKRVHSTKHKYIVKITPSSNKFSHVKTQVKPSFCIS